MIRRFAALGIGIACSVALASCGSSGSSGSTPTPGHNSPAAAVEGLVQALANHDSAAACSYFVPDQQSACRSSSLPPATGKVTIGHTAINGDRALVVVMSPKFCVAGQCFSNSDPSKGLPSGSTTFDQAYSATQNNSNDPTSPCQRVNGEWYVAG